MHCKGHTPRQQKLFRTNCCNFPTSFPTKQVWTVIFGYAAESKQKFWIVTQCAHCGLLASLVDKKRVDRAGMSENPFMRYKVAAYCRGSYTPPGPQLGDFVNFFVRTEASIVWLREIILSFHSQTAQISLYIDHRLRKLLAINSLRLSVKRKSYWVELWL